MAERPPSTWRVVWLLSALEARRWCNRSPFLRRSSDNKREGTQRKGAPAKLLLVVMGVVWGLQVLSVGTRVVWASAVAAERDTAPGHAFVSRETLGWLDRVSTDHLDDDLQSTFHAATREEYALTPDERTARLAELKQVYARRGRAGFHETRLEHSFWPSPSMWFASDDPFVMLPPLALVGFLLAVTVLCLSIVGSDRDLARSDASLEWWFTFPVPTRALLLARIFGTTLVNPLAWVMLGPFFYVVFCCAGCGYYLSAALGLAAALHITLLGACLRVIAETSLRRFFSPRRVAQTQAALEVIFMVPLVAVFSVTTHAGLHYVVTLSRGLPRAALYNPLSLPFTWLLAHGALAAVASVALLAATVYLSSSIGSAVLRDGLVSASEPVAGTRARPAPRGGAARSVGRVVAAREWLAIVREPARLARVVLAPLTIVLLSALSDRQLLSAIVSEPQHAGAAAFGLGMIVLIGGALVTLANEGPGLWLLYTAPLSLDAILARRAILWIGIASAFVLATLVVLGLTARDARFVFGPYAALALIGVGIYGFVAVALGALGTDVMESSRANRIQPFTPQLFMLLSGSFTFALYSPSSWAKFAQLTLSTLFAYALWQKLRDHTPYFLDATEAPPARIAVSDGIFAALAFFVMQGLLGLLFTRLRFSPGQVVVFSFAGSGLLVSSVAVWTLYRLGVPKLASTLGLATLGNRVRTVSLGVLAGFVSGAVGFGYTRLLQRIDWLRRWYENHERMAPTPEQLVWIGGLAVIAAPLFEELLFRGILYRGLRRSLDTRGAVFASALVFAIVHPATSFVPVFGMALCAATVFELTGSLFAPILTHMIYNGIVVTLALHETM